jgi:hypothetical protein
MDNLNHQPKTEELPGHAKEARELPEARDETTKQIHEMSNFSVSESLGIPLLTKDVGKTNGDTRGSERLRQDSDRRGARFSLFDVYSDVDPRDRLMAIVSAVMVLGPLALGAFR